MGCTAKSKLATKAVKSGRIVVHMLEDEEKKVCSLVVLSSDADGESWKVFFCEKFLILGWKIVHIKCHGQCGRKIENRIIHVDDVKIYSCMWCGF